MARFGREDAGKSVDNRDEYRDQWAKEQYITGWKSIESEEEMGGDGEWEAYEDDPYYDEDTHGPPEDEYEPRATSKPSWSRR